MCTAAPMELYQLDPSPPCRAVRLLARYLNLELCLKKVDLMAGEHLAPEYLELNPQHTVPTFKEDDFVLTESRAIMGYLVDRHAEDDALFPAEPRQRARVVQRLYFDATTLNHSVLSYMMPVIWQGAAPSEELWSKVQSAFGFLDKFLDGSDWAAGERLSAADFAIAVSTSNAEALGLDLGEYPNVQRWYAACKDAMPDFDAINQSGADTLADMFKSKANGVED